MATKTRKRVRAARLEKAGPESHRSRPSASGLSAHKAPTKQRAYEAKRRGNERQPSAKNVMAEVHKPAMSRAKQGELFKAAQQGPSGVRSPQRANVEATSRRPQGSAHAGRVPHAGTRANQAGQTSRSGGQLSAPSRQARGVAQGGRKTQLAKAGYSDHGPQNMHSGGAGKGGAVVGLKKPANVPQESTSRGMQPTRGVKGGVSRGARTQLAKAGDAAMSASCASKGGSLVKPPAHASDDGIPLVTMRKASRRGKARKAGVMKSGQAIAKATGGMFVPTYYTH